MNDQRTLRQANSAAGADTASSSFHEALADQIVHLAIKEGYGSGTHLTELELTRKLRVSRSPIRRALKQLEARGVVVAERNRGFFLVEDAAMLASNLPATPSGAGHGTYDRILRDYANGELPETVNESHLAARYEVGGAELRATLLRLSEHGILHRSQGKGWHFEPGLTTPAALEQSYRFRIMVECGGLLEKSFLLDEQGVARVRRAHAAFIDRLGENSADEFFAINADFHLMLAESSRNIFIQRAVETQNRLRQLHELVAFPNLSLDRMRQSCAEHTAILEALEEGDQEFAAALMRHHLDHAPRGRGGA